MAFEGKWMVMGIIMLSKEREIQKGKSCMFSLISRMQNEESKLSFSEREREINCN
jgi:hypothetical protein